MMGAMPLVHILTFFPVGRSVGWSGASIPIAKLSRTQDGCLRARACVLQSLSGARYYAHALSVLCLPLRNRALSSTLFAQAKEVFLFSPQLTEHQSQFAEALLR